MLLFWEMKNYDKENLVRVRGYKCCLVVCFLFCIIYNWWAIKLK